MPISFSAFRKSSKVLPGRNSFTNKGTSSSGKLHDYNPEAKDPRWDRKGFNAWAENIGFVSLGFLRGLGEDGFTKPVPTGALHTSLPHKAGSPGAVQLFAVISAGFFTQHTNPQKELRALLAVLKDAADSDLVFWDFIALLAGRPDQGAAAATTAVDTH